MNVKKVIAVLSNPVVASGERALAAGLPLQILGTGAYRKVYAIVGTDMVVKFPNPEFLALSECVDHARREYKAVTKVLNSKAKKYASIKKHMPKMYYFNHSTGVMVARRYTLLHYDKKDSREQLSLRLRGILNRGCLDVSNSGNVGVDGRGTLKVIDAGYLLGYDG